jgi:Membrane bound beta barrel domain (DUF5777)
VTRVLTGWTCVFGLGVLLLMPSTARAQGDDPAALKLAEPDFTLVGLPTSLRLPTFRSAFRVTHRFTRPLNDRFGDVFEDFFGLDSGAVIGLEYRFGIVKNGQVAVLRNNSKTIQFLGQYSVLRQSAGSWLDVSALVSIEGTNNFKDSYSPAVGAILSREIGTVAALYVEPIWVNNTNRLPKDLVDDNDTFMVGIGARVRIRPTVYLVGEYAPRSGNTEIAPGQPGVSHGSFGLEKRAGGHMFQVNFSNAFGTTMANIARGGGEENDWYLGFNITRKFF